MTVLEPGLKKTLRAYSLGQPLLLGLAWTVFSLQEDPTHDELPFAVMLFPAVLCMLLCLFQIFENLLGRAFLPVVATLLTSTPYVGQASLLFSGTSDYLGFAVELSTLLAFPLLLLAWQYRFRTVILFAVATTALDLLISSIPLGENGSIHGDYHHVAIARAAVFLAVGYVVTRLMKEQRSRQKELKAARNRARMQAAALENLAISRERNRIAREIHDTLAHTLSALSISIEAHRMTIDEGRTQEREELDRMLDIVRTGTHETRRALSSLRASPLETLGLAQTVRTLAQEASSRCGAHLHLDVTDTHSLLPEQEQVVMRITQEALENVVRHSHAKNLDVTFQDNGKQCLLSIGDDGVGFDVTKSHKGAFGILGMQERAELTGGQLQIESNLDSGTMIQFRLNMSSNPRSGEWSKS